MSHLTDHCRCSEQLSSPGAQTPRVPIRYYIDGDFAVVAKSDLESLEREYIALRWLCDDGYSKLLRRAMTAENRADDLARGIERAEALLQSVLFRPSKQEQCAGDLAQRINEALPRVRCSLRTAHSNQRQLHLQLL